MDENTEPLLTLENFAEIVEPPPPETYGMALKPPISTLVAESVQDASPALQDWVEHVLPNLLSVLSLHNAKGMSEIEADRFLADKDMPAESKVKAKKTLTEMPDQSLAIHTINAALSAWVVVELANLNDIEQRLYLAGITMHDFNKMIEYDLRLQGEQTAAYEHFFKAWAERLGVWSLISSDYQDDVAFLAQNAEAVKGENRNLANYKNLQTDSADLEDLSHFVRLADLLVSIFKHPDDFLRLRKGDNLRDIIDRVLRHKYVLRYHKTADNRGLLTQFIHNGVLEQADANGWLPFLYFPDGVTYLVPKDADEVNLAAVPARVRTMLVDSVSDKLGQLVTRAPTGMRFKAEFIQLLPPAKACRIAAKRIMEIISDKKAPVTEARKAKTKLKKGHNVTLDFDYAASLNADRLAEGLFGISKVIVEYYGGDREGHAEALLRALDLEDVIDAFRAIDFTGGVGYPWYYAAGHYTKRHPGMDALDVEKVMVDAATQVLKELGEPEREPPFGFLEHYVAQTLTAGQTRDHWDFAGELARYSDSKKPRSGKRTCAICNSNFEVRPDYSSFTNKQVISHAADARRGICEICQVESLLQRFMLGRSALAGDSTKFLHLYPTYFFTPITARVLRQAYNRIKNVVFTDVIKYYQQHDYDLGSLVHADFFQIKEPDNPKRRVERVSYPEGQMHGYYLLGMPYLGRDPSDTESWVMPALLALLSPLLLGVKAVVSSSTLPLYSSGADFPETVVLDAPHSFWLHGVKKTHFRLDELPKALPATIAMYGLLAEAYKDSKGYALWNQLGAVARSLDSEPLSVFGYADRISSQQSKGKKTVTITDGMTPRLADRLIKYYDDITDYYSYYNLGGKSVMGLIQETVDKYAVFYRALGGKGRAPSAYARLRPFSMVVDGILRAPAGGELDDESLRLQLKGALLAFLDRIRSGDKTITAYIPKGMSKNDVLIPAVSEFVEHMVKGVFEDYCQGDRAVLRKRLNDLKNGCEAYYVQEYGRKKTSEDAEAGSESTEEENV